MDVGCSNGAFLDIAIRQGLDAEGIEPAPNAARDGVKRGFKVHLGYVESARLPESYYDIVTMFEVIEHVRDPVPMLRACHRLLKPDGVLVVGTGNTDSWSFAVLGGEWDFMHPSAGHINYFSTSSLAKLASRLHFAVAETWTSAVTLCNRTEVHPLKYRVWKLAGQCLSLPARLLGKGHQLEMFLVKRGQSGDSDGTSG